MIKKWYSMNIKKYEWLWTNHEIFSEIFALQNILIELEQKIIVIFISIINQGTGPTKLFTWSIFKRVLLILYWFKGLTWLSPDLSPRQCWRYWKVFLYLLLQIKKFLSNILKYVFTRDFVSVEVNKINKICFRYEATSLRN